MSYEKAYSLEANIDLTPLEAHRRSILSTGDFNKLYDKRAFQCGKLCPFKLTLTNFGLEDYNKTPHFTPGARNQVHDCQNCDVIVKNYELRELETEKENHGSFYRDKNKIIIDVDLVKGDLAVISQPRQKENEPQMSGPLSNSKTKSRESKYIDDKTFKMHIKQLKDLVQYYLDEQAGERYTFFNKNNEEINLSKYFIDLAEAGQRNINLEDVHIYFDNASVRYINFEDKLENDYFLVQFKSKCTLNNVTATPTITINKKSASHRGVKYKLDILEKAAKDGQPLRLFFFGRFKKHPTKDYINPAVKHVDILDYLVIS